jgi:hypothetical protein
MKLSYRILLIRDQKGPTAYKHNMLLDTHTQQVLLLGNCAVIIKVNINLVFYC